METGKKFIEAESVKYKDVELIRKWKNDYMEMKRQQIADRKKTKERKHEPAIEEKKQLNFPKGAVLHFSGIKEDQKISREDIKEKLKEIGDIDKLYIDFCRGDTDGHVRFATENAAVECLKKLTDGELEIGEIKLKCKVLEGDEEEQFLETAVKSINTMRQNARKMKGRKRRGNFGDQGPRNKRKVAE